MEALILGILAVIGLILLVVCESKSYPDPEELHEKRIQLLDKYCPEWRDELKW